MWKTTVSYYTDEGPVTFERRVYQEDIEPSRGDYRIETDAKWHQFNHLVSTGRWDRHLYYDVYLFLCSEIATAEEMAEFYKQYITALELLQFSEEELAERKKDRNLYEVMSEIINLI